MSVHICKPSNAPIMCSGYFPDFCPLHTRIHFSPTASWKGLGHKYARLAVCMFVCVCARACVHVCGRIPDLKDQKGTSNSWSRFSVRLWSPPQHPTVLLEAATKTDRKEIEKSYNSNCHPENASQTERDQIEEGHYHFYYSDFPSSKVGHRPSPWK